MSDKDDQSENTMHEGGHLNAYRFGKGTTRDRAMAVKRNESCDIWN
jgi:hypothetical protein